MQRAFVPDPAQRVGEVRILRRGDATVVETLLYTKVLSRVVGEIRKKELANWPGSADVAAYLEALSQVQKTVESRLPTEPSARIAARRSGSTSCSRPERRSSRSAPSSPTVEERRGARW